VLSYVGSLDINAPTADEEQLRKGILDNADYLLHLIDNILFLSRLEAHMVEIVRQPNNFAERFEPLCRQGWARYQNDDTHYLVENPYEQLVVDIDADNLVHVIEQVTANAAQHTPSGTVRARYDYIGRRLIITVEDTGEGIPQEEVQRLNEATTGGTHNTKGLGLAITRELVSQMGGRVEISSELGSGTTVYIVIPCTATAVKRKKFA
jgi:signal transduction histidine kinase